MSVETYDELLRSIAANITKRDTKLRKSIYPAERLVITLRPDGEKTQNAINSRPKEDHGRTLRQEKESVHISNGTQSKPVSQWRRGLPQYLAALAKNLLLLDLGMVIAFPTIVIPPLLDTTEELKFTMDQASWFGSIVYFCQPLGSLTAAATLDWLGRKRSMVFLNIPFFCCWVALYYAQTVTMLFILCGIQGFCIGSIEASILTYVGEISEPRLRGTLTSMAEIAEYIGFVLMFFLGTVTDWRTSSLISSLVPVVSFIAVMQIPETPIWLQSRGRSEEALKALCWLRGWVAPDQVKTEYDELVRYSIVSKMANMTTSDLEHNVYTNEVNLSDENPAKLPGSKSPGVTEAKLRHDTNNEMSLKVNRNSTAAGHHRESVKSLVGRKMTRTERLKDFFRQEMMKPMFLVCSFFFFTYGSGMLAIRPYMVPVLLSLGIEMDPFLATTVFTAIGLLGCVVCTVSVRYIGKRPLGLISVFGCGVSCFSLGTYALYVNEWHREEHTWMPLVMMVALAWFTGIGMDPLPWMYLSEVFPFRGRSMACGVAAAVSYVLGFVATKSFLPLESSLTLSGVFFLYGCFSVVGLIYFYFCLPETEGIKMEDIEESYKKKKKIEK